MIKALVVLAAVVTLVPVGEAEAAQDVSGWSADIDMLVASMHRIHPGLGGPSDLARLGSAATALKNRLSYLVPHQVALETQRLLALAGDGHTEWAALPPALRGSWLPIIIRRFEEGWFVRTGDPAYADLFGKPITSIGEVRMGDAVDRVLPYVAGDNGLGKLDDAGNLLRNVRVLDALGVTRGVPSSVPVTVLEPNGTEVSVPVAVTDESWVRPTWVDVDQFLNPEIPEPLYRRLNGNYACAWLPKQRVVYVVFNEIRDDDGFSIADFFDDTYRFVRQVRPAKFVLDIRENSGGNLELNGSVLRGLIATPQIDRPGTLFVVIGRDTYSAAMNLAILLERHTHALFVGEPTGARPNHFGDTRLIELSNSGIQIEISELYWQNSDPRDVRPWITPDLPVPTSAGAFIVRRDPALEAILQFAPSDADIDSFGPPITRWKRQNQLQHEAWPPLLEPRARAAAPYQSSIGPKVEECIAR